MSTAQTAGTARDARESAEEPAVEESLSAHAVRMVRTKAGAAAAAVLDPAIALLQRLRSAAGGAHPADGAGDGDGHGPTGRPQRRPDAQEPSAQTQDPAPAPRRRMRALLLYLGLFLAGAMGGGALGFELLAKLLDRQFKESRRLEATISKHAKAAAAAKQELEQALAKSEEEQARRVEAEKKLESTLAENAKSSAELKRKLADAEYVLEAKVESRLKEMLDAVRGRKGPQPSSGRRDGADAKAVPVKTGDCKMQGSDAASLKDCIKDFYR